MVREEGVPDAGRRYRFEHLALPLVLKDLYFSKGDPGPGDRVPQFDLPIVGGGRFRSGDLAMTRPALLIFGSATCPVTDNAAPGLNELYSRFSDRVRFVMVNVREAHPGEEFPQPRTIEEKRRHAERLRDIHGFGFELAVDDVDGGLHRALSPKPNSAYIIATDGTILFRAQWANDIEALARALSPSWRARRHTLRNAAVSSGRCSACCAISLPSWTGPAGARGRTCGRLPLRSRPSRSHSRCLAFARRSPRERTRAVRAARPPARGDVGQPLFWRCVERSFQSRDGSSAPPAATWRRRAARAES
jgi:Iodothyronine deiodinase